MSRAGENRIPERLLGKTGVSLPIIGFGTAAAGTRLGLREAVRLYEEALEQGITYFDTAPGFAGYGLAQQQLGYVLKERRKEIFLVTKCFEPNGDAALKLLERNLRELQTDYTDLVFVHSLGADKMDPRVVFSRRGVYPALIKAKAQGLTRFVGFSGHNRPGRFLEAINHVDVDVLLNAVNFVDRHTYNFEEHVWPVASRRSIGLLAMKVYGGQLRGRSWLSHSMIPASHMDAAFRYALGQPNVASAAIGMATRKELHDNVQRAKRFTPLDRAEAARLVQLGTSMAHQWGAHLGVVG